MSGGNEATLAGTDLSIPYLKELHKVFSAAFLLSLSECYNARMHLVALQASGFRSLTGIDFQPTPGLNVIRGHNAQGKTSLLEALLFLATSKSHRTNIEAELVRDSDVGFQLRCRVQRCDREVVTEANWFKGVKRFRVNGVSQPRTSDILGKVNVVFFSPEDAALVRGSASNRRRFLDMELSQLSPGYLFALQQYRQVLKQRNELLRAFKPDPALVDVWDDQLASHGEVLIHERMAFVRELSAFAAKAYRRIAETEDLEVRYQPDIPLDSPIIEVLNEARESDLRNRVTTRGPHRDEIVLLAGGRAARQFASQGQQRTAALALKLAELELVKDRVGEYPVLMLDDVLSELDLKRCKRLVEAIPREAQCLLTTTDLERLDSMFGVPCANFFIQGGRLEKK